jgi:hypothetical protein
MIDEDGYWDVESYGEGYDCETCGWAADDIRVQEIEGEWEVFVESGCYSGWNEFLPTAEGAIEYLRGPHGSEDVEAAMKRLADRLEAHVRSAK